MREALKGSPAPVGTAARVAHTTKGQGRDTAVKVGIVDRGATRADVEEDFFGFGFCAERVCSERGIMDFVCDADGLIEVVNWEYGEDWAKGFFGDDAIFDVVHCVGEIVSFVFASSI